MKTLLVDLSTVWGGAQASMRDWVAAAPAAWRSEAVALVACERLAEALAAGGVRVERVSLRGGWTRSLPGFGRWWLDCCGVRKLVREVAAETAVIYVNGAKSASPWLMPGGGRLPLVVHLRDVRGARWLTRRAAGRAGWIIAISEYQAGIMRGRWGDVAAGKLRVIGNGVARVTPVERAAARQRLGVPEDAAVAVLAADFVDWKRHERLLGALSLAPDWHGILAGGCRDKRGQKLRRELESLATRLRLDGRVRFPGSVPMGELLGAADVVVSLADDEPFGRTVVEAMQAGKPVVAMPRGGPAELLAGYDGAIIAEGEPRLLAAALRAALARQPEAVDRWQPEWCAEAVLAVLAEAAE